MPFYTPTGLLLGFDPDALELVVHPLESAGVYENLLLDVHLWTLLPNHLSNMAAIVGAYYTHSWSTTLLAGLAGYIAGDVISVAHYSDWLRRISRLGNWYVGLVAAIVLGIPLVRVGSAGTAVVLTLVVLANWLRLSDIVLLPITLIVRRAAWLRTHMLMEDRTFVIVCNQRAAKLGVYLNWHLYFDAMEQGKNALA